ncbi:hypothetical protein KW539_10925 [Vibrio fluvialis]|nr:hypothetical protein [Vibrio fluvialis]MBY8240525.1 hypothetical protein [Vibrio fluvialis]
MKLTKRLFIGNQEYDLASHKVSLKLSLGGKAIFVVNADEAPKRLELVRFDIGYEQQTAPYFEGYIENVAPAANGAFKLTVKELSGVLSKPLPLSVEHPTVGDLFELISEKTGLEFKLPDADYTRRIIPNFVNQGDGYQCLDKIGKAFSVPDCVWYQHTDQVVYFGSHQDSHFHNKPMTIPHEFTSRQNGNSVTFVPFPMLRPGRVAFDKRITRVDLVGDEMTAYWMDNTMPAKQREIFDALPEVVAGYHLPIFGRVEAVRDSSQAGQTSDPFRPRYAVDVQILDEDMQPNTAIPVYRSIPLPVHTSGHESGLLAYPLEGSVVEMAFAYGRSDRPIIRGVYGREFALPSIEPGEQLQQQREEVSRRIDAAGSITDKTEQTFTIQSHQRIEQAVQYMATLGSHHLNVKGHSKENIVGKKVIEALGAVELLAGDNLELGSLGNMHIATSGELVTVIGKLRNIVIAQDDKLKVMGQRLETIEKDWEASAQNMRFTADLITMNGGKGVVQGDCICAFTGKPHSDLSNTVKAGK